MSAITWDSAEGRTDGGAYVETLTTHWEYFRAVAAGTAAAATATAGVRPSSVTATFSVGPPSLRRGRKVTTASF